ncbi:MAG: UDP-N-acetylmuramate--L-alanine ligase [Candidatus Omnitrophota bacterium]
MLKNNAKIHFIGIGGIGMSALAQVLLYRGYIITGSDVALNNLTDAIEAKGGMIYKGHREANIGDAQIVVYSSSISEDNPELLAARRKRLNVLHRSELLAELMEEKESIAVTGTHGKTTTAAMISEILIKAGCDPTCILGGESYNLGSNAYSGRGKFMVAEADESDGTHLNLAPKYAIITNIDREHLDYYRDEEHIVKTNLSFLEKIKPDGNFFGLIDDYFIRRILLHYNGRFSTFGLSAEADLHAVNIEMEGLQSRFACVYKDKNIGQIRLNVPGRHNILNALCAILFSLYIGIGFDAIAKALAEFRSTKRRFQIYPDTGAVTLIEDYAHHPTEISAVLEACRLLKPRRVIAVFQPHRYTRTEQLSNEFGSSFRDSDELILTNIYAASEKPIEGVSVKNIYDKVTETGFGNVHIIPKENIAGYLYDNYQDGDLIAVLGAGDIGEVAQELSVKFKEDENTRREKI